MDLVKLIKDLRKEQEQVDQAIRALESISTNEAIVSPARRRGRKSMSPQERLAVSERMRKYWASRKTKPAARKASS